MKLPSCKRCGRYNDPSEWPENMRDQFDPDLCYACARTTSDTDDEKEEEPEEVDDDPDSIRAQEEIEKEGDEENDD